MTDTLKLPQGAVVVGVDGSEYSRAALRWAVEHPCARCTRLFAVAVWEPPGFFRMGADKEVEAMAEVRAEIENLAAEVAGPDWKEVLDVEVVEGQAAASLRILSMNAEHLVVGSRGHSELVELTVGSTTDHLVHHASCPVTVVRLPRTGH